MIDISRIQKDCGKTGENEENIVFLAWLYADCLRLSDSRLHPLCKSRRLFQHGDSTGHVLRNILPSTDKADIIDEERTPRRLTGEPDRQRLRAAAHTIGRTSAVLESIRSPLILIREIFGAPGGDVDQLSAIEVDLQRASPLGITRVHLRLGVEGEGVINVFTEVGDGLSDVGGTVSAGPVDGAV